MKTKTVVYEMRRDGWRDYFELHVSPTASLMRKHAEEIAASDGWAVPADGWSDTMGMVHPVLSLDGPFAYLFLSEEALGVGVVAHECLHVATSRERFVNRYGMNYGDQIGEDEERLAYFLTSVIRGVYTTLYEHGHIAKEESMAYENKKGGKQ